MTDLKELAIGGSHWRITDSGLLHIGKLTGLTSLRIHYPLDSPLTDRSINAISGLTNLTKLSIDYCRYSDEALASSLSNLIKLKDLSLECSRSNVSGSFVGKLTGLTNLTRISMSGSEHLREENLKLFAALPALRNLDMSYTNLVRESKALLGNVPHIKLLCSE